MLSQIHVIFDPTVTSSLCKNPSNALGENFSLGTQTSYKSKLISIDWGKNCPINHFEGVNTTKVEAKSGFFVSRIPKANKNAWQTPWHIW